MFLASLGCTKIPIPGKAIAARFFSSPMVLVKQETPEKLPIYLPIRKSEISFRIMVLSAVFVNDSLGKACDMRMFRIFKLLTVQTLQYG